MREVAHLVDAGCERRPLRALRDPRGMPIATGSTDDREQVREALAAARRFAAHEPTQDELATSSG